VDLDSNGFIELGELKQALDLCGFKIPQYLVRQMIDEVDQLPGSRKGHLSFEQFEVVMCIFFTRFLKKFKKEVTNLFMNQNQNVFSCVLV